MEDEDGEGEEQFLPLIPIVGKVLGGLLGGLSAHGVGESELRASTARRVRQGEAGEAEEQFLHKILARCSARRPSTASPALTPAQEAEFAAQLLEVSDEAELESSSAAS